MVQSFREALRVLKPGGVIIVAYVDKASELGQKYLANRSESKFYQQATFFSTTEILSYLKTAGFGTTQVKQTLIVSSSDQTVLDGYGQGGFVVVKAVKEC